MGNTRELILDMLMEILEKGSYSHLVIRDVLDRSEEHTSELQSRKAPWSSLSGLIIF